MSRKNKEHIEEQLNQFPKHQMEKEKMDQIHQHLMEITRKEVQKERRVFRMKKLTASIASIVVIGLVAVLMFVLVGEDEVIQNQASQTNSDNAVNQSSEDDNEDGNTEEEPNVMDDGEQNDENQPTVEELSREIIQLLNDQKMDDLDSYVHPEKGLLFSPYVHIEDEAQIFSKEEITNLSTDENSYLWGQYDGSGFPIELTPNEFFDEFIYGQSLIEPDEVLINEWEQRGNTINNIKEKYPKASVVEYYYEGTEEYAGMDWSSLNLVFEQDQNGNWKLVALIPDQWTI